MTRLERHVNNMTTGETVYINLINASVKEIDFLKASIKAGSVEPLKEELDKYLVANISNEDREKYENGTFFIPQMIYRKK